MKAHKLFGSSRLVLTILLLVGGLTASAVTYADSIFTPLNSVFEGSFLSGFSRSGPTTVPVLSEATVTTDKQDYSPGEIVQISGSGFRPNEMVTLRIVHIEPANALNAFATNSLTDYDHSGHEPWDVMVNADGTFSSSWLVEPASLNQTLLLTADQPARDGLPAVHAETTFTDGAVGTYDQCSNDEGDGYPNGNPPEGCKWINGNLNANNSSYPEGTATVQRAELIGFGPNEYHSVTFQYGTTKNGKHAYDFLTGWDWSEKWITVADRCEGIAACAGAPEFEHAIPPDPFLATVTGGGWEDDSTSPNPPDTTHRFTMRGATFEKEGGGSAVSEPTLQDAGMTYAGTSETLITVYFKTPAADSPMCSTSGGPNGSTTCRVAIWFGAHVARTNDWLAENGTTGAGSISGSPYHVALYRLDGLSIGNRDNQMQAGAVTSQSLEVRKVLSPTNDSGRFDLLIDAGTVNQFEVTNVGHEGTTGAQEVDFGNHTVSETGGDTPPTNLNNYTTTLSCVTTASNGQETTQNFGDVTGNPSRQVSVPENGDVVCTFTNTLRTGSLRIVKKTIGGIPGKDYTWTFSPSGFGSGSFNIQTTGVDQTVAYTPDFTGLIAGGDYDVSETGIATGWNLTDSYCTIDGSPVSGPTDITIQPNKLTICTFENTEGPNTRGTIIIDKVTNPAGDDQLFDFSPTGFNNDADFQLADETTPLESTGLIPTADGGSYSIAEINIPTGWDLTSFTCTNGTPASITVVAGQTTTCTATNTKRGAIKIVKNTTGGDDTFTFNPTGFNSGSSFDLTTVGNTAMQTFSNLVPGSGFAVTETIPTGWNLNSFSCSLEGGGSTGTSNGSNGLTAITVEAGKTTTCTFANGKPDLSIKVETSDVNEVGDDHVFTVTVTQVPNGATPAATANITPSVNPTPDSQSTTCGAAVAFVGNVATCTFTINNNTAGTFDVDASVTATIGDVELTRDTAGTSGPGGNSGATKRFVDAQIDLTPLTATNEVGDPHVFTATVLQDDGMHPGGDGVSGFGPAPDGTTVTFSFITNTAGATFVGGDNDCTTTAGSCSVSINASNAGLVVVRATTTFSVGGVSLTRTTNSGGLNSVDAQKVYVDAQIDITPLEDTNPINEAHTFTAIVQQDDGVHPGGDGVDGFGPAPDGTLVTFAFVQNTIGAVFVGGVNTCTTTAGSCTVQINSSSPGVLIVSATTTFSVGGVSLTRTTGTGGLNSANAQKTYVAGVIIVDKITIPAGDPQLFDFDASWLGAAVDFQLADATTPFNSGNLAPGLYSVAEAVPAGWDLTSATCTGDDDGSDPASIQLDAGETVTCTFTNTKRGAIKIVKNTVGGDGTFQFNPSGFGSGSFDLTTVAGTANTTFGNIVPGTGYSITETNPAPAFDLTSFTCDRGTIAAIEVVPGETTTCTAVNTRRGRIIINKIAIGGDDTFLYVSDVANFPLTTVGGSATNTLNNVVPGSHFVREALGDFLPAGWDFNTLTCNDPSGGTSVVGAQANIGLAPGETVECTFTNTKRGHLELEKFTNGTARPDIDINFNLYRDGVVDGDLSGDETLLQSLSTLGDADGNLVFNEVPPGNYTVCEYPVPAGFTSMWTINGGVVTPYNPQANDTPPEDTGIRCYDFTIAAGQTVSIHVDNDFPGGDPRTIGYWKNWNRCTNGGQAANADANGGGANGFWLLEDLLPQTVGDLVVTNCQDGVDILDKSDLNGKKKANDAAYELAAQLLAAKLNLAAGAETCTAVQDAVMDGQNLLEAINFNGTGNYLTSKVKGPAAATRTQALQLANTLDQYNNGNLCP